MRPDYLTEVTGPWTVAVVETMIALNSLPETEYDRIRRGLPRARRAPYPAWVWDQPVNDHLLHVLGYQEPNDLGWRFVLDLTAQSSRRPVLPTLILRDPTVMAEKASAMLNYALTLPTPPVPPLSNAPETSGGRA